MTDLKVLLISDDVDQTGGLVAGLKLAGAHQVRLMSVSEDLAEHLSSGEPNVLVLDCKYPTVRFFEVFAELCGDLDVPVICFSLERNPAVIAQSLKAGVVSYIVDDKRVERIEPIVSVALARFRERRQLSKELAQLKDKLAHRAAIEKAKGLLVQAYQVTEDEAYHTMRKRAMNEGRRLSDLAREICDKGPEILMIGADVVDPTEMALRGDRQGNRAGFSVADGV